MVKSPFFTTTSNSFVPKWGKLRAKKAFFLGKRIWPQVGCKILHANLSYFSGERAFGVGHSGVCTMIISRWAQHINVEAIWLVTSSCGSNLKVS